MKNEDQRYFVVYKNAEDEVKTYEIGRPQLTESFGNKEEERNNIGFRLTALVVKKFVLFAMTELFLLLAHRERGNGRLFFNKFCPLLIIGFLLFYNFGYAKFEPYIILGLIYFIEKFNFNVILSSLL